MAVLEVEAGVVVDHAALRWAVDSHDDRRGPWVVKKVAALVAPRPAQTKVDMCLDQDAQVWLVCVDVWSRGSRIDSRALAWHGLTDCGCCTYGTLEHLAARAVVEAVAVKYRV